MPKQVLMSDFLTQAEIEKCRDIYREHADNGGNKPALHKRLVEEVVRPIMPEINRKLGQENDADYLAYGIEHVFNSIERGDTVIAAKITTPDH